MNPSAALMSTVEDVCDTLKESPGLAIADIINCVLRACGCNESVDADSAIDWDGVVDALDYFTEAVKQVRQYMNRTNWFSSSIQEDTPIYPLTSKLPVFKKLRKSLNEFLDRLIKSTADIGLLYDTDLMQALTTWIVAMSSSQIRSFRHTATVLALEIETALGGVAAAVEKEADITTRAREGERKRRAAKGGASGAREKELDAKSAEIRTRKDQLKEWLEAFYDG
jgi:cohesin complex subunit SA-1/2